MTELNESQTKEAMFTTAAELAEKMGLAVATDLDYVDEGDTALIVTGSRILTGKIDVDSGYMKTHSYEHYLLDGDTLWTRSTDLKCGWGGERTISSFLPEGAIVYTGR